MSYVFSIFESTQGSYVKTITVETMEEVLLNTGPDEIAVEGEYDDNFMYNGFDVIEVPVSPFVTIDTQSITRAPLRTGVPGEGFVDIYDENYGGRLLARVPFGDPEVFDLTKKAKIWLTPVGAYRITVTDPGPLRPNTQVVTLTGGATPVFDETWTQVHADDAGRMAWIETRRLAGVETVKERMQEIWAFQQALAPWDDSIVMHVAMQAYAYLLDPNGDANVSTRYTLLTKAQPMYGTTPLEVAQTFVSAHNDHADFFTGIYLLYKNTMNLLSQTFDDETHVNTLVNNFIDSTEAYLVP